MNGYYINLPSSTKRRWLMEGNTVTKSFIRVEAISPDTMPDVKCKPPYMTDTEKCCFLSHVKVWRVIAEGEHEYAVVCEDDVCLKDDFFDTLPNISGYDFVHLTPYTGKPLGEVQPSDIDRFSTVCYIISKSLCKKLSVAFDADNTTYLADMFGSYFPKEVKVISINHLPVQFSEENVNSTIDDSAKYVIKQCLLDRGVNLDCWMV